jgi:hypothetical protein
VDINNKRSRVPSGRVQTNKLKSLNLSNGYPNNMQQQEQEQEQQEQQSKK